MELVVVYWFIDCLLITKNNNNGVWCSYFTNACCSQVMFNTSLLLYLVNRYMKICSGRRRTLNARIVLLATIESLLGNAGINICTSNFVLLPRTRMVYSVILNFNPSPLLLLFLLFCCCYCCVVFFFFFFWGGGGNTYTVLDYLRF